MPQIFISYRRVDSQEVTGRIYDWLSREFGEDAVFMDTETFRSGDNWQDKIKAGIRQSKVMLIIIGTQWAEELYKRRGKDDWTYEEIKMGLSEDHIILIPVLVNDAQFPKLPKPLASLSKFQIKNLRPGSDFRDDIKSLIEDLIKIGIVAHKTEAVNSGGQTAGDFVFYGETDARGATFSKTHNVYGGEHPDVPLLRDRDTKLEVKLKQLHVQLKTAKEYAYAERNVRKAVNSSNRGMGSLLVLIVPLIVAGITYSSTANLLFTGIAAGIAFVVALIMLPLINRKAPENANEQSDVERLQEEIQKVHVEREEIETSIRKLQTEWSRKVQ